MRGEVCDIKKKLKLLAIVLGIIGIFVLLIYFGIFWRTMLCLLILIVVILHFSVTVHLKVSRAEGIDIKAKWLFLTLYPRRQKKAPAAVTGPPEENVPEDYDIPEDLDALIESLEKSDEEEEASASEEIKSEEAERPEEAPTEEKSEPETEDKPEDEKPEEDKPKEEKAEEPPKEKGKGKIAALKEKFNKIRPYIPIGWKAVKKFCKAIRFEGIDIWGVVGRFDAHEAAIYYGIVQKIVFDLLAKLGLIFTLKIKRVDINCCFVQNKIDGAAEVTVRVRPSTLIAIAFCTLVNFLIVFFRERRKRKKAAKEAAAAPAAAA